MTHTQRPLEQHRPRPAALDDRWFVDPEDLVCPGCGDQAHPEHPAPGLLAGGVAVPEFSHGDGSGLCRDARGAVAGPVGVAR